MIERPRDKSSERNSSLRGYLAGVGLVALATAIGLMVRSLFAPANIIMIYLLCVVVAAIIGGLGPSITVSVLSVLAFDFFFVPPYLTFTVDDTQYIFTFIALLLVGITISYFTSRVREQAEAATTRERETAVLYALGRDLAISGDLKSYVSAIVKRIKEALGYEAVIFLPDAEKHGNLQAFAGDTQVVPGPDELSTSAWVFRHPESVSAPAALPETRLRYLPLVTARGTIGVMALRAPVKQGFAGEQRRLLEAYNDLVAVAIEGILLTEELQNARVLKATQKLQTALLNAISHDLRTPLVSVIGTLSSLQNEEIALDDKARADLIQVAGEEADRLNHLITNLLDESRLAAGAITLSKQPSEVRELVNSALVQLGSRATARAVKIDVPTETLFAYVDYGLMVQTLANILDNAIKYSPPGSPIEVKALEHGGEIHIEITDHGIGVPEQDLENIFDKFYRIKRPGNVAGTGLGLSISKGIVEAHGGTIKAERGADGGTVIKIKLPAGESKDTGRTK